MARIGDCRLREMEEYDLEQVLEWRNSERIRNQMYNSKLISLPEHHAWFERMKTSNSANSFIFEQNGLPTGVVNFTKLDRENGICEWGFYLGRTDLPSGMGTCMGAIALDYAFERLELRKVLGEVLDYNQHSRAFHQKLGFKQEGRLKAHFWKNDAYCDIYCYAIFRDEWLSCRIAIIEELKQRGLVYE
jgi:UDP-4-amino-4,6-dideoxy-N-acetyl-beta-L-altrosamine N-acetyltransferase